MTGSGDKVARMLGPRQQEDLSYRSAQEKKPNHTEALRGEGCVWKGDVI